MTRKKKAGEEGEEAAAEAKPFESPKPQSEISTVVEIQMAAFIKYYRGMGLVSEPEWTDFLKYNLKPTAVSLRIIPQHRLCSVPLDSVPGIPSQAVALKEYMKHKYVSAVTKQVIEDKQVEFKPLEWYPNELGWVTNFNTDDIKKYLGLKQLDDFLWNGKQEFNIIREEIWSMLPPLLLEIKPYHKVLDMMCAPGFMASHISEMLHSDPNMANEGLLICNDWQMDRMQYRWTQGVKTLFTQCDATYFPDLYMSEEHTPENKLRYDRILCDLKCCADGTIRKNLKVRDMWDPMQGNRHHREQLQCLRRGLELLAVGGKLMYTTSSYNPVENEAVVLHMLKECEGAVELVDCADKIPGFMTRPGLNTWRIMLNDGEFYTSYEDMPEKCKDKFPETLFPLPEKEAQELGVDMCMRVVPNDNDTTGFFCALITKVKELPSVIKKEEEEIKAAEEKAGAEPEKPQYNYPIRVKVGVAVTGIEWTTEVTDQKLNTKITVSASEFEKFGMEMDQRCLPRKERVQDIFNPDMFCTPDDELWKEIRDFYSISDAFDPTNLVVRHEKRAFYLTTSLAKTIIHSNRDIKDVRFRPIYGVVVFQKVDHEGWCKPKCNMTMTDMGWACLYPYVRKQIVQVTTEDVLNLTHKEKVKFSELSDKAQAGLQEVEQGCVLFLHRPHLRSQEEFPQCNITFIGWKDENWVCDWTERKKVKEHFYRLCGMEPADWKRKEQDEKLKKALEKEKQMEAKMEVAS